MTFRDFLQPLTAVYDSGEARAIARLVMERRFGFSLTDVACGAVEHCDEHELDAIRARLLNCEPVQYVLGEATFCGRMFHVEPGVLIPRPETEWLCRKTVELMMGKDIGNILDIGTGSGCIACTVALETALNIKDVVAWDISDRAIAVARHNAEALGAAVTVEKADALHPPADSRRWDIIISNPPYICQRERDSMHENVLRYEPEEALFVPDDDPLLFYRAIAQYASYALKPNGALLFEINPEYADNIQEMVVGCYGNAPLGNGQAQSLPLQCRADTKSVPVVSIENDDFGKRRYAVIKHSA